MLALIVGDVSPAERDRVDLHVDGCYLCRELVAAAARQNSATVPGSHPSMAGSAADAPSAPRTHVMLKPGERVGRYVVVDFLGAGAMGVVYTATDPQLHRTVALKVVHTTAELRARRLVREARAMAQVSHPNVVPIYDAGQDCSLVFIAMKWIEGAPLAAYLKSRPRSDREILRLLCDAGRGLAAAHAAGVVHRDFKPDNILVEADGTAKVGDFGLAAVVDVDEADPASGDTEGGASLTTDGMVVGTPAYMAPECKRGERADPRSDQFSFAVTLAGALHAPPRRRIRRALDRARSVDPQDRFASIDELLAVLERRARTAVLAAVAAAVVVCGAVAAVWPHGVAAAAAACDAVPQRQLDSVLGPFQRAAVLANAAALTPAYARDVALTVERVDRYAARWVRARQATCRATEVTGDQPAPQRSLRDSCLDVRFDELAVVTGRLLGLTEARADSTSRLADVLGDLDECSAPLAGDPRLAEQSRGLRRQLAEASELIEQSDYASARRTIDQVLGAARADKLLAVEGAAQLAAATLATHTHEAAAQARYHDALAIAERIGDTALRVDALIGLLRAPALDATRGSEAELLQHLIENALEELPGEQRLRRSLAAETITLYYMAKQDFVAAERSARMATDLYGAELGPTDEYTVMARRAQASAYVHQGHYDEALALTNANIEAVRAAYGDHSAKLAKELFDDGVELEFAHHDDQAMQAYRTALAITENLFGPDHPWAILAHRRIGMIDLDHAPAEALVELRIALAGATTPEIKVPVLAGIGRAQLAAGDAVAAVATLETSLAQWPDSQLLRHGKTHAKFALARALWLAGGDRTRARRLAREARAEYAEYDGRWQSKAAEAATWLETHHP